MSRQTRRKFSYEQAHWRLITQGPGDGIGNAALDQAIAESVGAGKEPPTLRFYGWDPPCLSLGAEQAWEAIDADRCAEKGWQIVRRLTGGRAVLHADELSCSISAPLAEPRVQGDSSERYQRLSVGLLAGLKGLGLDPARARPYYEDLGPKGEAGFDGPSEYSIALGQRKLVECNLGTLAGAVLLQASMPLEGDVGRIADALAFDYPGERAALVARIGYRAMTLSFALGRAIEREEARRALQQGYAEGLDLSFSAGEPSEQEMARAGELQRQKYGNADWTQRR